MSFEKVSGFFDYVRKKGIVASNTVTGWSGAFSAVESVLDQNEKNLDFILENEDIIRNRLQNQNHEISGGTLNIYLQRSRRAIAAFREWDTDRAAWEKKMASSLANKPTPSSHGNKPLTKTVSSKATEAKNLQSQPISVGKRVYPIPTTSGDTFDVALPSSYKMADLPKVIWALAVYAEDFNPSEVLKKYGNPPINEVVPSTNDELLVQH